MGKKLGAVFLIGIFLVLIFTMIPDFLPDMSSGAADVTDNTSYPLLLRLVFEFWYLPVGLMVLGIITSATGGLRLGRGRRSRRRR